MTPTTAPYALTATDALTLSLLKSTARRLEEAREIKSPRELGIVPDASRNGRRKPGSRRHRAIR